MIGTVQYSSTKVAGWHIVCKLLYTVVVITTSVDVT